MFKNSIFIDCPGENEALNRPWAGTPLLWCGFFLQYHPKVWWGISENALVCIVGFFFGNTWIFWACLPRTFLLGKKKKNHKTWIIHCMGLQIIKWGGLRKRETSFKNHTISHFSFTIIPTVIYWFMAVTSWQSTDQHLSPANEINRTNYREMVIISVPLLWTS